MPKKIASSRNIDNKATARGKNSPSSNGKKASTPKKSKPTKKRDAVAEASSPGLQVSSDANISNESNLAALLLYGDEDQKFSLINKRTNYYERNAAPEELDYEFELRKDELKVELQNARKAIKRIKKWIDLGLFGENVRCSVALRKKNGRIVSPLRYVLEVQVPAKFSKRNLMTWPSSNRTPKANGTVYSVPQIVDGVMTKVVESTLYKTSDSDLPGTVSMSLGGRLDDISTNASISLSDTRIIGGIPVVSKDKLENWGTCGIVVTEADGTKKAVINSHFAASTMVQPPHKPKASDLGIWSIGGVASAQAFDGNVTDDETGEEFYVDAALIKMNQNRSIIVDLVHDFANEGFLYADDYLRHFSEESGRRDVNRKVFKWGAKTGPMYQERVEGRIENPEDTAAGNGMGTVIVARSLGGRYFTLPGDSGSVLVAPIFDKESNSPRERLLVVGLCFGGIDGVKDIVYACHFAAVSRALKLDLPPELLRKDWAYSR